jgi:5-methylcytosine-specific restriction endonuclease McrA
LLKNKQAKVVKTYPFVIKMLVETTDFKQELIEAEDSGSSKVGSAVVNASNEVVYLSEIEIRNDITEKIKRRAKYRRSRRNRKTRYRKCRFLNRKNSTKTGRFSPTMVSKINAHLKELKFIRKISPITETRIETANFDPHALKNPEVLKDLKLYQEGYNYGFANTKAYVLDRDNYRCQNKKCASKCKKLEVHHIVFRSNNGSDEASNLITLCKACHDDLHDEKLILNLKGKKKGNLKHATQMNSIRIQLMKALPNAIETYGFVTKEHRQKMNLPKEHFFDAVAIASKNKDISFRTYEIIYKKCVAKGDYQLAKGVRSEQKINTGKINGFRKFDKVKYDGKNYFIKGRMTSGYAILMGIDNQKIELKPIPKVINMKRISARKNWLIDIKKLNLQTKI